MALNKCSVVDCKKDKPRRFFVCHSCWDKIPKEFRLSIHEGIEKGSHSLRITPNRSWVERIIKYVGYIKVPYVMGAGYNAVKLAADKKEI